MNAERSILEGIADETSDGGPRLSPRQRELITLLARGESNKQIARTLGITEGTVKQHLSTLYKKLGVNSRTKAIVRASELFGFEAGRDLSPADSALPSDYAWRLITAVAFVVQDSEGLSVVDQTQLERRLRAMHQNLKLLAEAFDGQLLVAPGGNMLLGFGAPHSHLDDAARALFVARTMRTWVRGEDVLRIGMGVAASPTLVGYSDEPVYRSKAFELAFELAHRAKASQVLASELVCRQGGPLFLHRPIADAASDQPAPRLAARELIDNLPDGAAVMSRLPLPFTQEVFDRAKTGLAQWISIAGWPPSAALNLMDMVSLHCQGAGFETLAIRLAGDRDPAKFSLHFYRQLRLVARLRERAEGNETLTTRQSDSQRIVAALKVLSMRSPMAIVVYGVGALEAFERHFGDGGLQQLALLPLVMVVIGGESGSDPHVTARLLGSHPLRTGTGIKSFRLPLPPAYSAADDLHRDLATLLDLLSPPARQAVRLFVLQEKTAMVTGNKAGGLQLANELVTSGLFVREGESIVCRDALTRAALKRFFTDQGAAS